MATSQNGYPVLGSGSSKLHTWTEPDSGLRITLRNGSTGFLLIFWLSWFHWAIERVNEGQRDDWGYAPRKIRGSATTISNHASGTAEDINATQHPLGVPTGKTFTPAQQLKIRKKLKNRFRGLIRWGGDYKNRPDPMHFEIVGTMAQCEALARVLMKTPRGKRILKANPGQDRIILS